VRSVPTSTALRRKGVFAGLAVVALVATACGSSNSGSGSSSSAATSAATSAASSADTSAASSSADSSSAGSSTAGSSADSSAMTSTSGSSAGGGTMAKLPSEADCTAAAPSNDAKTATSAKDFGDLCGLVAAAKKEGAINVIALPPDWADYKEIISTFQSKYPSIKLTSQQPDASSAQEIQAADTNKGTDQAPDVFDVGAAVALQSTAKFAPYKVSSWADIPDANKEATGLWVNDYSGVMTIGYNADTLGKDMTSIDDLKDPKLKGAVALNGDPTQANSALLAVTFAGLASGGSLDDISKGVDFFKSLKTAGTLSNTKASAQAVQAGTVGAIIDWSYNQLPITTGGAANGYTWKTFTPAGINLTAYYNQAINKDAPHPAAARLWEEYLYTAEAQNFWIKGGALPILYQAMDKGGMVDADAAKNLPAISGDIVSMNDKQTTAANTYLAANWAKAIG
jgi:putative spermidine/putrescine transport system substrate-binding protein